ncbi:MULTISPECIES: helix-turn-helix transcriptional regulator [Pandoraea]|uniref:helix-turn-helix domain-containing protein n=1 Tax=Pandoraea TaxID=93217 RepID=UPI001F5E28E1|nr:MULTISPECIES: helix-turn-helix transcriptional regulator [Pandoraea]
MSEMKTVTTYGAILGAVLAQIRSAAGLKQSDLAEAAGVGPSTWSRIEKGESSLSTDQLKLASDKLGISPSKILEMVDVAEKAAAEKGVKREPVGDAQWTAAASAIALGLMPVVGPMLGGIIGAALKYQLDKVKK